MTIDISEESLSKESADLLKILLKDRTDDPFQLLRLLL